MTTRIDVAIQTPRLNLTIMRRPRLKLNVLPRYPYALTASLPIILSVAAGVYNISFDGATGAAAVAPYLQSYILAYPPADGFSYGITNNAWSRVAPLDSPALIGNPTAPTPALDDNDTSIATTQYVMQQASGATPQMNGVGAAGISARWSRGDHVHPTDTSRQPLDAELTAIAGLASAADKLPYFTGVGTAALADFTSFGRSLVDDANAAAALTTLGIGAAANPTASIGLAVINGAAVTYMRSDAAPPLSQSITPTWTGAHIWSSTATFNGVATFNAQSTFEGQAVSPLQTLTDGATISTWDCSAGQKAKVTLGAAGRTMAAPTNMVEGTTYFLWVIQDATGNRTITTWNAAFDFGAAGAPTLTTTGSRADLLTFECITIAATTKMRYTGIAKGFA